MRSDKQLKKDLLKKTSKDPDSYYATDILRKEGFERKKCPVTGLYFWTVNENQEVCGDSEALGQINIYDNNPAKQQLSYTDVWKTFAKHMMDRGYAKINRYPVVARWNPTTDFVMASIAAFQPYVISGEAKPPAKKLIIPQFSLRFGDVDNVGVTGAHNTGFVMIGQHQFVPKEEWDQNKAFEDLFSYLTDVIGLPKEEITLHEDAWAGGGNFGPCMEFFSRGVELCNQVYMMYEETDEGEVELSQKVLDMGLGQERVAWFSQAAPTIYDATFPEVLKKLKEKTGVTFDYDLYEKFAPFAPLLNLDEVDDINQAWDTVAKKVGMPTQDLKQAIQPMVGLYSISEHARALLFALTDGALPGNSGGYYNLRVIFRRAQDFIEQFDWDVDLREVAKWHAEELQEINPELLEDIEGTQRLLRIEFEKYQDMKKRSLQIIDTFLKKEVTTEGLLQLYASHGVSPELVKKQAAQKDIVVSVPENFYKLAQEMHEKKEQKAQTKVKLPIELDDLGATEPLYYISHDYAQAEGTVLRITDNFVVLDRTVFYPTSGGQLHDTGTLDGQKVVDVKKVGKHVVHILEDTPKFKEGDKVRLIINIDRRMQLAQHHTAAHVLNGAAKAVLGNHVWQAGAAKGVEKGRLDITHYAALTQEELDTIEFVANDAIKRNIPIVKRELPKALAEQEFGFRLYQGGAVPGDVIRVIDIEDFDVEACGGTHLKMTGELQLIKILRSSKVQDGVVRIEYVAGKAAHDFVRIQQGLLQQAMQVLGISDQNLLVPRTEELFSKWKKVKKLRKKKKEISEDLLRLSSDPIESSDPLTQAAAVLSVQEEQLPKTLIRFMSEWKAT